MRVTLHALPRHFENKTKLISRQTRGFAAVLFRKIASRSAKETDDEVSKELFMTLLEPEQKAICSRLLECLAQEGTANVRGKIADSVAEVARQYILEGELCSQSISLCVILD